MSAITSNLLYALSDAKINSFGYEPDQQEKLITIMDISETGAPEDRIAALEKKVRDMDALVKGLLEELLDFRAVAMTMTRQNAERDRLELKQGPVVLSAASQAMEYSPASLSVADHAEGVTVIRPREAHPPAAPAEPTMVRIMQTDGTMKMEPRYGETNTISSTAGYGRNRKGAAASTTQNPLIYAAEEDKSGAAKK
jgi:hypothetical protein